jgi:putative serine protease PepD
MKLRTLVLAALFAGGFVYFTSKPGRIGRLFPRDEPTSAGTGLPSGLLWSGPSVGRAAGLSTDEISNIEIYKTAHLSTVNITSTVYKQDFFFNIYPARESGSGFLVNADGLIVTNNHVISGGQKIQVTMADKSRYEATVLHKDPANDLAMIKIAPKKKLQPLRLGDSEKLQVGQKVLAIGNPFGLEGTLTTGVISSIGRNIRDESNRTLEGMVQTDAAINPGNSGGPLLDSQGNVIGVNTAIYGPGGNIGIGFAMPISRAKAMMDNFQTNGRFRRPRLGVDGAFISGDLANALDLPSEGGFLVYGVEQDSPAAAAGLRGASRVVYIGNNEIGIGGDLIMEIDGRRVDRQDAIASAMARKRVGDSVELTIFRRGRLAKIMVPLSSSTESERL